MQEEAGVALAARRVMILVVGMAGMETGDCGTWPRTSLAQTTKLKLYNMYVAHKTSCNAACVEVSKIRGCTQIAIL